MTDAPATRSIPVSEQHRWRAYWVCVAVAAITILDLSKVNVALPSIEDGASARAPPSCSSSSRATCSRSASRSCPRGGSATSDRARRCSSSGSQLFTAHEPRRRARADSAVLLIARLLQGVAAGIQMPQVLGLIQQLFQGKERGRAFGLFGATIGIATAFGPTLGGLLILLGGADDGWRWIFWMNVPLGIIAIALAIWLLPETRTRPASRSRSTRRPRAVRRHRGLADVAVPVHDRLARRRPAPLVAAGRVRARVRRRSSCGSAGTRRRASSRSSRFALFRIGSYRNGTVLSSAYFAALPAMFLLTTLFLQNGLGLAAVYAGMVTIGFALASAVTSWIGGNLVNRIGRPIVVWGLVLLLVGVGLTVLVAFVRRPR